MGENQFAFRITLMTKIKKRLNFCPRLVHVFRLILSFDTPEYKITFSVSTLIFVQHKPVQVIAYKSQYLRAM